jgi:hypothetical protein
MAATLGFIPFVSGFYITDKPARGILFTAVDVLMVLSMYTARNTPSGNPGNVKGYFVVMGVNNVLDAFLSARYARNPGAPYVMLGTEGAGVSARLHWKF